MAVLGFVLAQILQRQIERRSLAEARRSAVLIGEAGVKPTMTPLDFKRGPTNARMIAVDHERNVQFSSVKAGTYTVTFQLSRPERQRADRSRDDDPHRCRGPDDRLGHALACPGRGRAQLTGQDSRAPFSVHSLTGTRPSAGGLRLPLIV